MRMRVPFVGGAHSTVLPKVPSHFTAEDRAAFQRAPATFAAVKLPFLVAHTSADGAQLQVLQQKLSDLIRFGLAWLGMLCSPNLGSPLPHLNEDWAHPCHICTRTALTPAASAPGLRSPLPHLHRD